MQAIVFLKELERLSKPVITINDAARIIQKGKTYARVYINRLAKKNLLYEIEKGKYALSDEPFETGSNLLFPSYISFISAYSIYGLTTQSPIELHVVSLKSKKPVLIGNTTIIFIKFKKRNFFGYKRERSGNHYIFIAEPEKAVVDSLYLPRYCPIAESYTALKSSDIKVSVLIDYAVRMNSIVTIKRLGYLLELHGRDIYKKVKRLLNNRYDKLNPYMPLSKEKSAKWKLNINEALSND